MGQVSENFSEHYFGSIPKNIAWSKTALTLKFRSLGLFGQLLVFGYGPDIFFVIKGSVQQNDMPTVCINVDHKK